MDRIRNSNYCMKKHENTKFLVMIMHYVLIKINITGNILNCVVIQENI